MKFNLKTKILIVMFSVCCLAIFSLSNVVSSVFKEDKISYVINSDGEYLDLITNQISQEFKIAKLRSELIISNKINLNKDYISKSLQGDPEILGVWTTSEDERFIFFYKSDKIFENELTQIYEKSKIKERFFSISGTKILITYNLSNQKNKSINIVYESLVLKNFYSNKKYPSSFLIDSALKKMFFQSAESQRISTLVNNYVFENLNFTDQISTNRVDLKYSNSRESYILTSSKLEFEDFYLLVFTPATIADQAISFYNKKILVILMIVISFSGIVSLFLSNYLTLRLKKLINFVDYISNGNFDQLIEIKGSDEIAKLSEHVNKMNHKVAQLLTDSIEKTRMESELKTASIVQSTLFPKTKYSSTQIELYGNYKSSSECGGDWWHYFENQNEFFIIMCDATGHGVPAALLTSAAMSALSILKNEVLDIEMIAKKLNRALYDVSKGQLMMTAFMIKIDKNSLQAQYINCSHEVPFFFKNKNTKIKKSDLRLCDNTISSRLGESLNSDFIVNNVNFESGDILFVYTDGCKEVEDQVGSEIGERGLLKRIFTSFSDDREFEHKCEEFNAQLFNANSEKKYKDDITYCFVNFLA